MQRLITILLATIALAGLLASIYARIEQRPIRQEYQRHVALIGAMKNDDPKQFHIRGIETDNPYHLAWRFYRPDNLTLEYKKLSLNGSGWSRSSSSSSESIVRINFRFTESSASLFFKHNSGSSTSSIGDANTAAFLQEHWDELEIEGISGKDQVDVDSDRVVRFLTIRVPQSLHAEVKRSLGPQSPLLTKPVIDIRVGTPAAFAKAKSNGG